MPLMSDKKLAEEDKLRVMIYGPSQTKKTWWMGAAAEAGFNVLLLDGDGHHQVLHNLSPEAQARIRVIKCADQLNKPVYASVVSHILKGHAPLLWDEEDKKIVYHNPDLQHNHAVVDVHQLTTNDLLVVDSWYAVCTSIALDFSQVAGIDLSLAEKQEWPLYGECGRMATWILQQIEGLPCHFGTVGHSVMWERRRGGKGADRNDIMEARQQVISTSGNHAKTLPKFFSDMLVFSMTGNNLFYVDGRSQDNRDSGSRCMASLAKWEEFQFNDLIKATNCRAAIPDTEMPGCKFYAPGELPEAFHSKKSKLLNAPLKNTGGTLAIAPEAKPKGLAAFVIKGKT